MFQLKLSIIINIFISSEWICLQPLQQVLFLQGKENKGYQQLLNIGHVPLETNTDVHICTLEEFILLFCIPCCTSMK